MEPKIIFEDEDLLVIDKPAGMVVNRSETTKAGETVQDWAEKKIKAPRVAFDSCDTFYARSGICHRLDKGTSGLLVIAKTPEAFADIQEQFRRHQVEKKYLALVHGLVKPPRGVISGPVGRNPFNRKKFGVFLGGREAETEYRVISNWKLVIRSEEDFSLLEALPKTGRTHQIRVHLKHIGHPVVGDSLYGGRKAARSDRRWCPRQFLHAFYLKLVHPSSGRPIKFFSGLHEDLKQALAHLKVCYY